MSKDEARAIIEYYAQNGMLSSKVGEEFISEKYSLARMGKIGALEMTTVQRTI